MRGIPGMQAANAGEIGNAAYALAGKHFCEIEFDQPLSDRVSHVTLAQFNMRLVINAHAALELGILVDLSLELFDQPHCFYLVDAVAQCRINQPEQSRKWFVIHQRSDADDHGLAVGVRYGHLFQAAGLPAEKVCNLGNDCGCECQ